jgi:hypothetical protein
MTRRFLIVIILLGLSIPVLGQSDYIYLQEFKKGVKKIETKIKKAKTDSDFNTIDEDITGFYTYYKTRTDFLDKALYPKTFDSTIENLKQKLYDKKEKELAINKANKLEGEVSKLKSAISNLAKDYTTTLSSIDSVKGVLMQKVEREKMLLKKITELKENLAKRNSLIVNLLDSVLTINERALDNGGESNYNQINIKPDNLFDQLEVLLNDNIKYLEQIDKLSPEEFSSIFDEQNRFEENFGKISMNILKKISPENYPVEKKKEEVIALTSRWKENLQKKLTGQFLSTFNVHGVKLDSKDSFDGFFQSILDYVEKKSIEAGTHFERVHNYKVFVDTLWNMEIMKNWSPVLEKAGLLNAEEINTVQKLNADWKQRNEKTTPIWLYIIISFILGTIVIYIVAQAKRNKYKRLGVARKKKREYEEQKKKERGY